MRTKPFASLLLLVGLTCCHQTQLEADEFRATILAYEPTGYVCEGGYKIQLETKVIYITRSTQFPTPYADFNSLKLPAEVWIRFKSLGNPVETCGQPPLIQIVSIRPR